MSESDGGTELASLAVAIVALVVAAVALLGTTAQVLQQYLATAVGYYNCGERVLGPWARHTKLVFRPWELRFEVVFRSPEISVVSLPRHLSGMIRTEMERWDLPNTREYRGMEVVRSIRTADAHAADYSASWLALLSTVRDMECSNMSLTDAHDAAELSGPQFARINVHVQAKIQTLDLMPEGVKKPYATTTLSSIIHLAAMLGLHWKEIDRRNDRYLADGNGLLITGSAVPHLGIMFAFTRHGHPDFTETTRVVPSMLILEFCFGLVPTILQPPNHSRPRYLTDVPRNNGTLRLGSPSEIASTLALLGCDRETIAYITSPAEHLFPVIFELVGMLGQKVRARGSPFRMLPNPLPYRWDTSTFTPLRLIDAYTKCVEKEDIQVYVVSGLSELVLSLRPLFADQRPNFDHPEAIPGLVDRLHNAVDWCDKWLKPLDPESEREILLVVESHLSVLGRVMAGTEELGDDDGPGFSVPTLGYLTIRLSRPREQVVLEQYFDLVLPRIRSHLDFLDPQADIIESGSWRIRLPSEGARAAQVWLVLMFRMVCWLNLHSFHPGDIQLPKSDLMGSRLPVYIS